MAASYGKHQMTYAYCDQHAVSWDGDLRDECLECEEERGMMPSKYEPGSPPDENYCDTHTDYLRPCRVCRAQREIDRAEEAAERKADEMREEPVNQPTEETYDSHY